MKLRSFLMVGVSVMGMGCSFAGLVNVPNSNPAFELKSKEWKIPEVESEVNKLSGLEKANFLSKKSEELSGVKKDYYRVESLLEFNKIEETQTSASMELNRILLSNSVDPVLRAHVAKEHAYALLKSDTKGDSARMWFEGLANGTFTADIDTTLDAARRVAALHYRMNDKLSSLRWWKAIAEQTDGKAQARQAKIETASLVFENILYDKGQLKKATDLENVFSAPYAYADNLLISVEADPEITVKQAVVSGIIRMRFLQREDRFEESIKIADGIIEKYRDAANNDVDAVKNMATLMCFKILAHYELEQFVLTMDEARYVLSNYSKEGKFDPIMNAPFYGSYYFLLAQKKLFPDFDISLGASAYQQMMGDRIYQRVLQALERDGYGKANNAPPSNNIIVPKQH